MIVVPAIDIRDGKVVRLKQGELRHETVYGDDPLQVACHWEAAGAARLHVVDLSAAISAKPQFDVIEKLIRAVRIPVEVGGGLRVLEHAMRYRDRGAERVIFGTAAVADPGVVQQALALWPEAVAVALDARQGKVVVGGWKEITTLDAAVLAERVRGWGVTRIQYTDVVRDGSLVGFNLDGVKQLATVAGLKITVAGGLSSLDDIRALSALGLPGVDEIVAGKALYEKRFTLQEAIEVAR